MTTDIRSDSLILPREYNAASHFVDRHVEEGRGAKTAFIDDQVACTYDQLAENVNRAGNMLRTLGAEMETRVMMCMLDTVEFPAVFWGAIKAGVVPVPVNTLLTSRDYDYMLRDCRARILIVSDALLEKFEPILDAQPHLKQVVVAGSEQTARPRLADLMQDAPAELSPAPTTSDDIAFWLYTSGSTGQPKGAVHIQSDLIQTAVLYGERVLGIREDDLVFSAAKLFFAYGLGNGMSFPLHVGATTVLHAGRPTPDAVMGLVNERNVSLFYAVPTLFGAILADERFLKTPVFSRLRLCVSAGEALPEEIGNAWKAKYGVDILDGLGSTEMLHIFLSNSPGDVRYGTSGKPVPGYDLKLVDEDGEPVPVGEIGELLVSGPSSAIAYWNQREKSRSTFEGRWTRSGDKYVMDADGYYHYSGRTDDMLKVAGNWVSPFEVESALIAHQSVREAAVVGQEDENGLTKPKAYVVLKENAAAGEDAASELQQFVKDRLAPYKYPRWIHFVEDLPKTATGKIQRFKLRNGGS